MVSIPLDNAQKETYGSVDLSAKARFLLGIIPLDGIDRFDNNVFDELLFDIMAKKGIVDSGYALIGYERFIHRKVGVLTYELKAYYRREIKSEKENKAGLVRTESDSLRNMDSVLSQPKDSLYSLNLDKQLPLGLKTLILAKEQSYRSKLSFKHVIIVACVRPDRFSESILERIKSRTGEPIAHYNTGDWVRIYVAKEYTETLRKEISQSFEGAWKCEFGK